VVLVAAGLGWNELGKSGGHPVPYRLVDVGPLVLDEPVALPTRKQSVLDRLLGGRRILLPHGREAVLISPGPRSSTGYGVQVRSVVEERQRIIVRVRKVAPRLGDPVRAIVTYPYRLVMMPASPKHVTVHWDS